MYQDPNLVRERYASVNFNDRERTLIDALVYHSGQPKSVVLREMLLKEAYERLGVGKLYKPTLDRNAQ